jgi:hypothetical protein
MKRLILYASLFFPVFASAQYGIKAGVNFANVTNASSINSESQSGFMIGGFLAPPSKGILGYRSEIIYSKQGYDYKTNSNTGSVSLDYILLPQLMCINITKLFQLQAGFQMAFLINAEADSTTSLGATVPYGEIMDYYNKFDYGFAAGAEVHPFKGLLVGARWNISLANMYEDAQTGQQPSFRVEDAKNNVIQIFAGWQFGGKTASSAGTSSY